MNFEGGNSAEQINDLLSQLGALREINRGLQQKVRDVFAMLGAREVSGGAISIDYKALLKNLGPDAAKDLCAVLNETLGAGSATLAQPAAIDAGAVLAPLAGKTVTILAAKAGEKPKLRIHRNPAAKAKAA